MLKKKIKMFLMRNKNKKKNVILKKGCNISANSRFEGNNVVKVLYDVYAELDNNENSVNYKLKNRLEQPMEAQIVVIKYNGLKMSSLECETISS